MSIELIRVQNPPDKPDCYQLVVSARDGDDVKLLRVMRVLLDNEEKLRTLLESNSILEAITQ